MTADRSVTQRARLLIVVAVLTLRVGAAPNVRPPMLRDFGDDFSASPLLFDSHGCGPSEYIGGGHALNHWFGALIDAPDNSIATRADAFAYGLNCGVKMLAVMRCQEAWRTHHCVQPIESERAFSLGGRQWGKRWAIMITMFERAALGQGGVPTRGVELASFLLRLLSEDMFVIGGDENRPLQYSRGPIYNPAHQHYVQELSMGLAFMALADGESRSAAAELASRRGWGTIGVAHCVFGAFDDALADAIALDDDVSVFDMLGDHRAYNAYTMPMLRGLREALPVTCRAMTQLLDLYMLGGAQLGVRFMDADVERGLSPWLLLDVATQALRVARASNGGNKFNLVGYETIYGTAHYMLAVVASNLYDNAGMWDATFKFDGRLPQEGGFHRRAMRGLARAFLGLGHVEGEGDDFYYWLSLLWGIAGGVALLLPRLTDDGDGDAAAIEAGDAAVALALEGADDEDDDEDDEDEDEDDDEAAAGRRRRGPGNAGERKTWRRGGPETAAEQKAWTRDATRRLLARRGIAGRLGLRGHTLALDDDADADALRVLRRRALAVVRQNDAFKIEHDRETTIISFQPNVQSELHAAAWGSHPTTVEEIMERSLDLARLARNLPPYSDLNATSSDEDEDDAAPP